MKEQYSYDYITSIILTHGEGPYVCDISGKKYLDLTGAWGANILGYAHPSFNEAITDQIKKGILFSLKNIMISEFITKLLKLFPSAHDAIILKTGSESTTASIRIARAFTGREKIIRCGYHGWNDWCNFGRGTTHPDDRPQWGYNVDLFGIPTSTRELTIELIDPNKIEMLEFLLKEYEGEIAALIIDPTEVFGNIRETLNDIQRLVKKYGVLFILDEAKTGFRIALGGAQEYYSLDPDLTILSKAISNGIPIGIVLGKKDVMKTEYAYVGGTYSEETIAIAAAIKTINILEKNNGIMWIWKLGNSFIKGLNKEIIDLGMDDFVESHAWNEPPMPFIRFKRRSFNKNNFERIRSTFFNEITQNGLLMYHNQMNYITLSHTETNINEAIEKCIIGLKVIKSLCCN